VGFVYSWSRLSTVLSSFIIAALLGAFGPPGVFAFIAWPWAWSCGDRRFRPAHAGKSLEALSR